MAIEIERKFLVRSDGWREGANAGRAIRQAYLARGERAQVRLRIFDDAEARLTIKSRNAGLTRSEFEYPVPVAEAEAMLALCDGGALEKRRYELPAGDGLVWEVDVFSGRHDGLVLAEIELEHADQSFARPDWLGREVSEDPAYSNAALARADRLPGR